MIRKILSNSITWKTFLQFCQKTGISLNKFSKKKSRKVHWFTKEKFYSPISFGLSLKPNNWWYWTWKTLKWMLSEPCTNKSSKKNKFNQPQAMRKFTWFYWQARMVLTNWNSLKPFQNSVHLPTSTQFLAYRHKIYTQEFNLQLTCKCFNNTLSTIQSNLAITKLLLRLCLRGWMSQRLFHYFRKDITSGT